MPVIGQMQVIYQNYDWDPKNPSTNCALLVLREAHKMSETQ